ncbi:MAG: FAD:protein FMN transferase [Halieaceae bacterium]
MLLLSCAEPPPEPFQLAGATMGTRYHIAWLPQPGSPTAEQVHLAVEARLESINASMSTYRDDSEISRFNASPVGEWFELSAEFAQVFAMARSVGEASGGAYDVSVGPLVDLWGFGPAMGDTVPSAEAIAAAMEIVGESQLEFDDQALALRKPVAMELDFSSIAKGYAVDVLAEWLLSRGVADFLVEVGGEIRVAGERPSGGPWRIAVEKPDHAGREMVAAVMLSDAAVATSGDYRNFFEVDGVRYSHTIDPRTGAPVRHELVSVTVIEASAAMADAWATALTVLGTEKAMTVAIEQGLAVYLISRSGDELVKSYSPAMAPLLGID